MTIKPDSPARPWQNRCAADTKDYWPRVQAMIDSDIRSRWEWVFRYLLMLVCGVFLVLGTEQTVSALLAATFFLTNGSYSWLLFRVRAPISRSTYLMLSGLLCASISVYTAWAVSLFQWGSVAGIANAIASIAALAVFNMSRHRLDSFNAVWSAAHVVLTGLYFGLAVLLDHDFMFSERVLIFISTFGACSYYAIAHYRTVQVYEELTTSRQEVVQTQKMRAIGQLTAGVAHDFNNILTVIRGNVELAELGGTEADRQRALNEAKAAADRAAMLTSQLLSFSRRARLQASAVDMSAFWETFKRMLERTLPAHVSVTVDADPALPQLYCDRNQLENALLNLVINARDAMVGGGSITLTSRPARKNEIARLPADRVRAPGYGIVEVRDTGPGIPAEHMDVVTEPFFTTKPPGEGSGLGLSMAKGFSEQSDGGLRIRSDRTGTTIRLLLPVAPV